MQEGNFYHIYNRANGKENLFIDDDNYIHFLQQLRKYITPIADIYAYCLMPNHFHFVILIKSEEELNVFFAEKLSIKKNLSRFDDDSDNGNLQGFENLGGFISQQFSNFFNSYSKAFNKRHKRKGS